LENTSKHTHTRMYVAGEESLNQLVGIKTIL